MNIIVIMGNLTRSPELYYTPDSMVVCKFGIAANRKVKGVDKPTFIDCIAFSKKAELINEHFEKGKAILITGMLDFDQWEKDGVKRSKHSIIVNNFDFIGKKSDDDQGEELGF